MESLHLIEQETTIGSQVLVTPNKFEPAYPEEMEGFRIRNVRYKWGER